MILADQVGRKRERNSRHQLIIMIPDPFRAVGIAVWVPHVPVMGDLTPAASGTAIPCGGARRWRGRRRTAIVDNSAELRRQRLLVVRQHVSQVDPNLIVT